MSTRELTGLNELCAATDICRERARKGREGHGLSLTGDERNSCPCPTCRTDVVRLVDGPKDDFYAQEQGVCHACGRVDAPPSGRVPDQLLAAINWLMGCGEDFTPRRTPIGTVAPYWWRSVFAQRAGLTYDAEKGEYVAALQGREKE